MGLTSVSRPTKRTCYWIIQDDVPSRLSPLSLYDSSVLESIRDEKGRPPSNDLFTGKVREWKDLSGNNRHITFQGTATENDEIYYSVRTTQSFPINSSVKAVSSDSNFGKEKVRRLEYSLSSPIKNQSFEAFIAGGFTDENPSNFSSLFSSGSYDSNGQFPEGIFQLCYLNGYFYILVRNSDGQDTKIKLTPFETGIKTFHLKYNAQDKSLETRVDGSLAATVENTVISFYQFKMFSNRVGNKSTGTEIRYLAVFGQLLSSQESKDFGAYQNCKWDGDVSEIKIIQIGSLDYTETEELTGEFAYAATRISPINRERRISLLSMILKPSVFGQNFSVRIFIENENTPSGDTLVVAGSIEGFSSSSNRDPQRIDFGTYRPESNSVGTFISESVIIPANSWAWIAVTSGTPFEYGLRDQAGSAVATVNSSNSGFIPPHQSGDAWDIQQNKAMPIIINEMMM